MNVYEAKQVAAAILEGCHSCFSTLANLQARVKNKQEGTVFIEQCPSCGTRFERVARTPVLEGYVEMQRGPK